MCTRSDPIGFLGQQLQDLATTDCTALSFRKLSPDLAHGRSRLGLGVLAGSETHYQPPLYTLIHLGFSLPVPLCYIQSPNDIHTSPVA